MAAFTVDLPWIVSVVTDSVLLSKENTNKTEKNDNSTQPQCAEHHKHTHWKKKGDLYKSNQ